MRVINSKVNDVKIVEIQENVFVKEKELENFKRGLKELLSKYEVFKTGEVREDDITF